ncbi:MAG: LysM peptidoglycan-binding domain-containing protein [Methylococcaceae bacterium]|nr:LysM peptidoglycan-binding domain-containing protein [Methylococcaceae bacterium]MCI0666612.1 LysM peptidoglycan-binding domain-containing protein [Methylococcaceae bacterium]MCI0734021.1 LysM peptidoglycan-binding domain-containing protein [Methylococcaceae bacterium]
MSFRTIHGFLFFILLSFSAAADELTLNPSHPERYTVVRGDTLWDISAKFLDEPWRWPEIWHNNPRIKNPDLIYPGDVIVFGYVDGKPSLSLEGNGLGSSGRLSPRVREEALEEAIPLIPIDAIKQFLSPSRVVPRNEIEAAPYIVAFAGEHLAGGAGQNIYVKSLHDQGAEQGYMVFRKGIPFKDFETQENLGYDAIYIGDTKLLRGGDPATFELVSTRDYTAVGDRLLPIVRENIRLNYQPRPPETEITGHIISVLDGVSQIGQYNVVAIDRGLEDGLDTGHVLEIYQSGQRIRDVVRGYGSSQKSVKLPDERAGILMVFRPFDRISYALVMKATGPIHVYDLVRTP